MERKIHLRDPGIPNPMVSLCFDQRVQKGQLTDDPNQVTCGRCQRMMKRQQRWKTKE